MMLRGYRPVLLALLAWGCGDLLGPHDHVVEGVNLTTLLASPTPAEIAATYDDWSRRDVSAKDVATVVTDSVAIGTASAAVRIVSHGVGGVRHFGAIVVPNGPTTDLPVLVVAHPGDVGIDLDGALQLLALAFGGIEDEFIFVVPSFRAESISFRGARYESEGPPSPWDRDVDDALALLNVALETTPRADSSRIGVLGLSRGGCVGMLMAIRDPRISVVVEFFGPTDFLDGFTEGVIEDALRGTPRALPGLADLDAQFIQPLKNKQLTIAEVRAQLVRRSPVYFVERLPDLQVHHGTADPVVPVSEAERLISVMRNAGRDSPEFESYLYPNGVHDPFTLEGSVSRAIAFLERLVAPAVVP